MIPLSISTTREGKGKKEPINHIYIYIYNIQVCEKIQARKRVSKKWQYYRVSYPRSGVHVRLSPYVFLGFCSFRPHTLRSARPSLASTRSRDSPAQIQMTGLSFSLFFPGWMGQPNRSDIYTNSCIQFTRAILMVFCFCFFEEENSLPLSVGRDEEEPLSPIFSE